MTLHKKKIEEKKQAFIELNDKRVKQLRADFNKTFGTEHGRRVLYWLMHTCGYHKCELVFDPSSKEVMPIASLQFVRLRELYLSMRKHIHPRTLAAVENKSDEQELFS